MLQERINRVINNHQLSCQHTNHYLYILKGFNAILPQFTVPVEALDKTQLAALKNFYITYEEALDLDEAVIRELKERKYDLWIVDFNWFNKVYLTREDNLHVLAKWKVNGENYIAYPVLDWQETRKTISIFNTNNPSIGFIEPPIPQDDSDECIIRYRELLKELGI